MKTKLILLVGPPCAGKSTWSRKYLSENPKSIHISRDDLRMMLRNQMSVSDKIEFMIESIMYTVIEDAFACDYDVIIDQTNCKLHYIKSFFNRYKSDSDIEIKIKLFNEDTATLFSRNIQRAKRLNMDPIPNAVIENMVKNYEELLNNEEFKKYLENGHLV